MKRFARRVRTVFHPARVSREIRDEMRAHIEMEAEDLIRDGMTPSEAHRQARARFGGVERYTAEVRDAWPLQWMQRIVADVRFAVRSLCQTPAFTLTAVVALAVGMGANATVFSAVDAVALRPLAVRDPSALHAIYGAQGEATLLGFSYPTYRDLARSAAFSAVVAFVESPVTLGDVAAGQDPTAVWASHTSDNYFSALGVTPAAGSFYQDGDIDAPVVVLSHALWASRFRRDPRIVGRSVHISGRTLTVIGVAPAQFTGTRLFTFDPALWMPAGLHPRTLRSNGDLLNERSGPQFHVVGRVRDGVTRGQAQVSTDQVAQDLASRFPELYRALRIQLVSNRTPINPWLASPERIQMIGRVVMAGCLLVLLIACANVSGLLTARMTARRQEIAVRLSLGASRGRLVQQLLTESLVLAAVGAAAAVPVHLVTLQGVAALVPALEYPSGFRPPAEQRVLLVGIMLTVGAALVFGLAPALQAARPELLSGLRGATAGGGRFWVRFRESIVVGQAVVSALTLVAGGLFIRSLQHARALDPGFAIEGAVTFTVNTELLPVYDAPRTRQFYQRLEAALAALPGVQSFGRAVSLPLDGNSSARRVFSDGSPADVADAPVAEFNLISPGFLAALGTPLVEGREFVRSDTAAQVQPAIINDVLARRVWPDESAIGKRIRLQTPEGPLLEVIGVARASMYRALGERPRPALWLDLDRHPQSRTVVLVRASESPAALPAAIRRTTRGIDPQLPIVGPLSLRDHVGVAFVSIESAAIGALAFGALAVLLAASGLYGMTTYAVSLRRREIGLRMALGARGRSVLRLVAGRVLLLTVGGAVLGGLIVALVPMGLESMLLGVSSHDLMTVVSGVALFAAVALTAAAAAVLRLVRLAPMHALRLD